MANSQKDFSWILPVGVLAMAYFGLLKPLTDWLGLTLSKDKEQMKKEIDEAKKAPGWSSAYYKQQMAANVGKVYCLKRSADLDRLAAQIYNAWGTFDDDENTIYAAFRELQSQVQLSQLVERYSIRYQSDLLTRLTAKWSEWYDGLEPEDFLKVATIVNELPVNVTC